jgi:hypothetical protein
MTVISERTIPVSGIGRYWVVSGGIGIGDTKPDTLTDTMTQHKFHPSTTHATAK